MDLKRNRAGLITAAAAAVVLVMMLPPRPYPERAHHSVTAELWQYLVLPEYAGIWRGFRSRGGPSLEERTAERLRRTLADIRLADSLLAAARRSGLRQPGGRLTVLTDGGVPADSARAWLTLLEREVEVYPSAADSRPADVVVVLATGVSRAPLGVVTSSRRFAPRADGRSACFVIVDVSEGRGSLQTWPPDYRGPGARTGVLDACGLYARYGPPGSVGQTIVPISRRGGGPALPVRVHEGASSFRGDLWLRDACLRGTDRACTVAVLGDDVQRLNPYWAGDHLVNLSAHLLRTRSGDLFARLWRSDEALSDAYLPVYGASLAELSREWMSSGAPVLAGPAPPPRVSAATLGWILLASVGGLAAVMRRRVTS
jgi:hypothetical protein